MNKFLKIYMSHLGEETFHGITVIFLTIFTGFLVIAEFAMFILNPIGLIGLLNLRFIVSIVFLWFIWFKTII